jgi:hypothetical protein
MDAIMMGMIDMTVNDMSATVVKATSMVTIGIIETIEVIVDRETSTATIVVMAMVRIVVIVALAKMRIKIVAITDGKCVINILMNARVAIVMMQE